MSDVKKVDDWVAFYAPRKQEEGEITAQQAADQWGMTWSAAKRKLNQMVNEKKLERIDDVQLANGKRGSVYRPVKK